MFRTLHFLSSPAGVAKVPMDLDQYVQPIIEYVRVHQVWAAPIVFVLCFAESLAFISLLIPAWGALVGIGALISAERPQLLADLDRGRDRRGARRLAVLLDRPQARKPRLSHVAAVAESRASFRRGEAFIRKWGAFGIFIGRFSGPLRASVPLVAGVFAMPYWRFQFANFTSAFVWAAVLLTLGDVTSTTIKWLAKLMGAS